MCGHDGGKHITCPAAMCEVSGGVRFASRIPVLDTAHFMHVGRERHYKSERRTWSV